MDPRDFLDNEIWEGVPDEVLDAILDRVTPEEIRMLISALSPHPVHAEPLRLWLVEHYGTAFTKKRSPRTQLRYIRVLMAAAVRAGYPVCSHNEGIYLGGYDDLMRAARRCYASARGDLARGRDLERAARRLFPGGSGQGRLPL